MHASTIGYYSKREVVNLSVFSGTQRMNAVSMTRIVTMTYH